MDHQLNARINLILAENAALRGGMQRLAFQGEQIMATQQQILDVLSNAATVGARAQTAITHLEAENADLKAQLAAAQTQGANAIDGNALDAAVNSVAEQTKALSDAIPAGSDETVGGMTHDAPAGSGDGGATPAAATDAGAVDNLAADPAVVGTASADAISTDHSGDSASHVAL